MHQSDHACPGTFLFLTRMTPCWIALPEGANAGRNFSWDFGFASGCLWIAIESSPVPMRTVRSVVDVTWKFNGNSTG